MDGWPEVVITGVGIVSPIGIGCEAFWESLCAGRSGITKIEALREQAWASSIGGVVTNFDAKDRVRPRKALKVMSRDIQMGFVAADLAVEMSGIKSSGVEPERLGIVFGADLIPCELDEIQNAIRRCIVDGHFDFSLWGQYAMSDLYPLWLLKYLPNMPACHIGIAHDARGPNNTLTLAEVSGLASLIEAVRVIQRGEADVMIAGGTGSRINPSIWVREGAYELSKRVDDPQHACRPFDAARDGMIHGEGAGAVVLERRDHAVARGARILAQVLGYACTFEPRRLHHPVQGTAIRQAIRLSLRMADLAPRDVGHVNAHGVSTVDDDRAEAKAIHSELGDVPVTALKSFFGNLAAGTGIVEMAGSLLAFAGKKIPFTLNYETPDPECPIDVVAKAPRPLKIPTAVILNHSRIGQAVSLVLAAG
ncbi:MAG: beta-ketoacyl-[acyl-carrier-protein] synthase family protein [Thermogutta sp.]|nr:beta-ketoacyl-[acyl-carrier-protein] synthase family protein [Thermogutta sp.]HOP76223.1 beta-ketoacyl-[acyl-carrier-protein] synthase family protein [Thermogutta sp.]HPU07052.1 beta-ketoacyl-[acyl-carrier-protein] synthase family protein [Thermogutta sp.]HQF13622.1 beta-ketoacyl-[acyl-carrier-protein] synthase family protein [Thermogutta sp.]